MIDTDDEPPEYNREPCPPYDHFHCAQCDRAIRLGDWRNELEAELIYRQQFEDWQGRERVRICEQCFLKNTGGLE